MKKTLLPVLGMPLVVFAVFALSMYFITGRFLVFTKPTKSPKITVKKTQSPSGVVTRAEFPSGRIGFYVLGTFLSPIQPDGGTTFLVEGNQTGLPTTIYIKTEDGKFSIERHQKDFSDSPQAFDVSFTVLETIISSGRKAKLRVVYDPGTTNPEEILAIQVFTNALDGTLNIPAELTLRPVGMEIVGE